MSKRILSGMQCIPLLLVIVFCVSCNEIEKIELNKTSIDQIDEEYLSQLPINFELGKEHIDEAVSNLSLIYREEYGKKQIEYIRPINSNEETILWLVKPSPNPGYGHRRRDEGNKIDGAKNNTETCYLIEQQGDNQGDDKL